MLVIGDSLGIDLGWGFSNQLPGSRTLDVTDMAVGSSGVVRWDYYNWPAQLRADLHSVHPQFVVALFGANDQQSIQTSNGPVAVGTKAWDHAYESRVRELASIVEIGAEMRPAARPSRRAIQNAASPWVKNELFFGSMSSRRSTSSGATYPGIP